MDNVIRFQFNDPEFGNMSGFVDPDNNFESKLFNESFKDYYFKNEGILGVMDSIIPEHAVLELHPDYVVRDLYTAHSISLKNIHSHLIKTYNDYLMTDITTHNTRIWCMKTIQEHLYRNNMVGKEIDYIITGLKRIMEKENLFRYTEKELKIMSKFVQNHAMSDTIENISEVDINQFIRDMQYCDNLNFLSNLVEVKTYINNDISNEFNHYEVYGKAPLLSQLIIYIRPLTTLVRTEDLLPQFSFFSIFNDIIKKHYGIIL